MGWPRLVSERGKLQLRLLPQRHSPVHIRARTVKTATQPNEQRLKASKRERQFFESVLSTSTTKREAKSFLSRFKDKPVEERGLQLETPKANKALEELHGNVNLGTLYSPYKAVEDTPVFTQHPAPEPRSQLDPHIHVAIVKIRDPASLSDEVLSGVTTTLGQLARLGVVSVVVVDYHPPIDHDDTLKDLREQCLRIVDSIDENHTSGARIIDQSLLLLPNDREKEVSAIPQSKPLSLWMPDLVLSPLKRRTIPVIAPVAYSESSSACLVEADDVVFCLTKEFSTQPRHHSGTPGEIIPSSFMLDRIIFLESNGGIPDPKNPAHTQPFVNLESEYKDIHSRMLSDVLLVKSQVNPSGEIKHNAESAFLHLKSIECIRECLSILPPSASALVTTAEEVASSADGASSSTTLTGVRTRPKRNPLIHNILTDKPMVSSSLPAGRFIRKSQDGMPTIAPTMTSTVFKHGMPVSLTPDPRFHPWHSPSELSMSLRMDKSNEIDFNKLQFLIEDSFNRPLDMQAYMKRVHKHLAGIIIAGDYEGGAILTWEDPPNRPGRPAVPYLDKFAVLKRCQGSGGVADVVFNAMVRDCFPNGVAWRSRKNNPVNKWYFERATGTWELPGTQWTMFWTGDGVDIPSGSKEELSERFEDYIDVCRNIRPNWADNKPPD